MPESTSRRLFFEVATTMDANNFLIDSLKRANCLALMTALNTHWGDAAYGKKSLERDKILELVFQIKSRTNSILTICQSQPNYVPWRQVKKRKNQADAGKHQACKRLKADSRC